MHFRVNTDILVSRPGQKPRIGLALPLLRIPIQMSFNTGLTTKLDNSRAAYLFAEILRNSPTIAYFSSDWLRK